MPASTAALLTHERLAEASERLAPLPAAANRLTAMLGDAPWVSARSIRRRTSWPGKLSLPCGFPWLIR
jgi:hypothetical protein